MKRARCSWIYVGGLLGLLSIGLALPVWAQKGKPPPPPDPAIAFQAEKNFSWYDLMVMNADGSNQRLVLEGAKRIGHQDPSWSPDGRQLVFFSNGLQGRGIYVINPDGTGLQKIVATNDFVGSPAWSPVPLADGQFKIAFTDAPAGRQDLDLFLVNLDGSGLVNLTNTTGAIEFHPTWERFATRLAAKVYPDLPVTQLPDLIVYDLGFVGGSPAITDQTNLTASGAFQDATIDRLDWATTQDKIAVGIFLPGQDSMDIWVFDLANPTNPVNLTNTPTIGENMPNWSPDDSKTVFVVNNASIYVMNADGSGRTKIATRSKNVFAFEEPDWRRNP